LLYPIYHHITMSKIFTLFVFCIFTLFVKAQTQAPVYTAQPFGQIDVSDLKMTSCDFEKDANAMVLFDQAVVETGFTSTTMLRHKRIKILNDKGKDEADVTIEYYSAHGDEDVSDVEAQTININKNVIEYTKVDPSLIYKQAIDKFRKKVTFSFPNVKPGSVIEFSYKLKLGYTGGFPNWDFQERIPVRYSELKAAIRSDYSYKVIPRTYKPYTTHTTEPWIKRENDTIGNNYTWAMSNIGSYKDEPYATGAADNIQRIEFILVGFKYSLHGTLRKIEYTWQEWAGGLVENADWGGQLTEKIADDTLIAKAKSLKSDNEKISYIFNSVKNSVKWNERSRCYLVDGVKKVWEKKIGNSTEINFILYNFLQQAGIKCYPELFSTRQHGKLQESIHDLSQFNTTVVSVAYKDTKYILDASDKYNTFNDFPFDLLNTSGLFMDPASHLYTLAYLKNENPSRKVVFVNAEIKPEGVLEGTAQINNFSYNRINSLRSYGTLGENKYTDLLKDDDNNLKIISYKRENTEIDSLPLTENIAFKQDLTGSDDTYIYFNPNLFTSFKTNPFLSEVRNSTIDFGSINSYAINGRYKVPTGYKIESLPKSLSLLMPDKSISFKRIVAEQDGDILVNYKIDFKKALFLKDEYVSIRDFYKKMYEMLNEQIVLKKI